MNKRRFASPLLVSLAAHAVVALVLSVIVVAERTELVEAFTADIVSAPTPKAKPRYLTRREIVQPIPPSAAIRTTAEPRWSAPVVRPQAQLIPTTAVGSTDAPNRLVTAPTRDATPTLNVPLRPVAPSFRIEQANTSPPNARVADAAPVAPDQPLTGLSSVLLTGVEETVSSTVAPEYLAAIRKRIERFQRYPRFARESGVEGTTTIRFTLLPNGYLEESSVANSSGSKTLDEAALQAVRDAAPFAPFPKSQRGAKLRAQLPIVFQLTSARR